MIEPALDRFQWAELAKLRPLDSMGIARKLLSCTDSIIVAPATIAILNAGLPDSDPRKITRAHVELLRFAAGLQVHDESESYDAFDPGDRDELNHLADALESYLPPRPGGDAT